MNKKMSSCVVFKKPVVTLRAISHELRKRLPQDQIAKNDSIIYMLGEYRKHQVTDKRTCRPEAEMQMIAETYLSYLNSTRLHQEIHQKFYSKGERSFEETARMVGLALPKNTNNNHNVT